MITQSWLAYRESRRCSRDTYPASYITKYTSIRRFKAHRQHRRRGRRPRRRSPPCPPTSRQPGPRIPSERAQLAVHSLVQRYNFTTVQLYSCIVTCAVMQLGVQLYSYLCICAVACTVVQLHSCTVVQLYSCTVVQLRVQLCS